MSSLFIDFQRLWIVVMSVISQLTGMIWYGNALFGNAYARAINMSEKDKAAGMKGMMGSLIGETIVRLIFFFALALLLQYVGADHKWMIGGLYFIGALSSVISGVLRSNHRGSLVYIMGGKMLLDIIIALLLYKVW